MKIKKGPWEIIGTKLKYKNHWISVREDKVIRPDGKPGIFGVVTIMPGSSVLPMDDEGNVYLTKEFHYGVERTTIEVVSGGMDAGETPLEAAQRELEEEVGLKATDWTALGHIDPFTSVVVCQNYLFIAKGLSATPKKPEGTEQIETIKMPFEEALSLVLSGEITHGASVAVILKASQL